MKTMLITGASSGIGKATALAAAEDGWQVIACGRNQERLDALAAQSANIKTLAFDLSDLEACKEALSGLSPDVAVLNAGNAEYVDVDAWESDMFRRVFEANFFSAIHCVEVLLPDAKPGNQIVFIDSLARLLPFTRSEAYGASKAAMYYLAKSLEVDLKDQGVIVQTISPGFVRTPLTDKNEFDMPMRVEPEEAAQSILKTIRKGSSSGYFPTIFASIIRFLGALPSAIQVSICRSLAKKAGSSS